MEGIQFEAAKPLFNTVETVTLDRTKLVFFDYDPLVDDWETKKGELKILLQSPSLHGVVLEYFHPQITKEFAETPLFGKLFANIAGTSKRDSNIQEGADLRSRMVSADRLLELVCNSDKIVMTTDIANNPVRYMTNLLAHTTVPLLATDLYTQVAFLLAGRPDLASMSGFISVPLGLLPIWIKMIGMRMHKGMFDRNQISTFEKFQTDIEDARRILTAYSLKSYDNSQTKDGEMKQLLVILPKAHRIRIVDILKTNNPTHKLIYLLKREMYKKIYLGLSPGLSIWDMTGDDYLDYKSWRGNYTYKV